MLVLGPVARPPQFWELRSSLWLLFACFAGSCRACHPATPSPLCERRLCTSAQDLPRFFDVFREHLPLRTFVACHPNLLPFSQFSAPQTTCFICLAQRSALVLRDPHAVLLVTRVSSHVALARHHIYHPVGNERRDWALVNCSVPVSDSHTVPRPCPSAPKTGHIANVLPVQDWRRGQTHER